MNENGLKKSILFSIPYQEGDESCYLTGNFNCYGDGSLELLRTEDGKRWETRVDFLPGAYEYFYSINQYIKVNEKREKIVRPIKAGIRQETFFHDPYSDRFFSKTGGFNVIRCVTSPLTKSVKIIQKGHRKHLPDFKYNSTTYNLFEFITRSECEYIFLIDETTSYGPYSMPAINEEPKSANVIYQIFPDRFRRKGELQDGLTGWNQKPGKGTFFGGNIEGIMEKLDYLRELGVDHIYLTPFYKSTSNHRYDIDDYFEIDEKFGTMNQLVLLSKELERAGISMILDMVFNHTSIYFPQFRKELKGKLNHEESWYKFISETTQGMKIRWPVKDGETMAFYEAFKDYGGMPKLNHKNEAVKSFMLSVMEYYAEKLNVSFLRYDVAESINLNSIKDIFSKFSERFPKIGHIAEVWCLSEMFFGEGLYTSSMNYHLRELIISLMKKEIGPGRINRELLNMRFVLGGRAYGKMMNILGSHDTARIKTRFESENLSLAAYALLMIMDGMPSIYYGDEFSMEGGSDPDCRGTVDWKNTRNDFNEKFRSIVKFRKENQASYDGIIKFTRKKNGLIRILKYSSQQTVELRLNLTNRTIHYESPKENFTNSDPKNARSGLIGPSEFFLNATK